MHEYMTRQMVALKPMTYDGVDLRPGDPFMATPDDATYFSKHRRAEEQAAGSQPAQQAPAAPQSIPAAPKRGRGRPSKAELAARAAAEVQAVGATQTDPAPEGDPDEHSEESGA